MMYKICPLTWVLYVLYRLNLLDGSNGIYKCDPERFGVSRIIFYFIPIVGRTEKGTKFTKGWYYIILFYWEIHFLIRKKNTNKISKITFP